MKNKKAYLVLADGTVFNGISMGKEGTALGEVVFNTCTASYGELLSDPTYYGQIVAQTYPLVGNRGVEKRENGSKIMASGYVVREWCDTGDLGEETLDSYLKECGIVGISGIDTRRLTRAVRDKGYMKGAITDNLNDFDMLIKNIKNYTISGAVEAVTVKEPQKFTAENPKCNVAVIDYGSPRRTLDGFLSRGCSLTVVPADFTAEQLKNISPDGIFLSDGPADPDDNPKLIDNIKEFKKLGVPMFGIGLGHQMLALSEDFKIEKMPQGHRGSNQPVVIKSTGKLMVTEQNHGYSVEVSSISADKADITMINVNDGSCEGLEYKNFNGFGVQFTPDSDRDSSTSWIFDRFVDMMGE